MSKTEKSRSNNLSPLFVNIGALCAYFKSFKCLKDSDSDTTTVDIGLAIADKHKFHCWV